MDDQLTKPLDERQLERVLLRLLVPEEDGTKPRLPPVLAPATERPSLQARYLSRRSVTFTKIEAALELGFISDEASEEIRALAHQLAGIAGIFGEARLGDLASQLEDGLQHWSSCERVDRVSALHCQLLAVS